MLVLKQLFSCSTVQCLMYYCDSRVLYKRSEFKYINMNLDIFLMALQRWVHWVKSFKAACLHHKREEKCYFSWTFTLFVLNLITPLAVFIPAKKNPEINYICLTFQAACCHFAICRPACPVQCGVFTEPLWLSEQKETLFSCFSPQFRAFFSLLSGLLMRLV